jgi:hypothetical protein
MTKLRCLAFLALLSVFMAVPGCAHVQPVINAVVTCSGRTIPAALVNQVYADVMTENWADIVANVVPLLTDGYADVLCIFGYLQTSNPETVAHIEQLKTAHADAFRASTALRSPGDSTPPTGPTLDKIPRGASEAATFRPGGEVPDEPGKYFYAGPNPGASLAHCDRACGDNAHDSIAPAGTCECFRKVGSTWQWVAVK